MDPLGSVLTVILVILLSMFGLAALIFLIGKIFGFTFLVLGNIFRFVGAEITDTLRFVGSVLASVLFAPLVVLSIVIGRWSASRHYAGALMSELRAAGRCVYRVFLGNPARLLGLGKALEGIEQRVPDAMAAAPTRDKPGKRVGMFEGYKIVGSLKGGGSGGKLYIAEPDEVKQAVFAKRRLGDVDQVVIKVFSLRDGSSLPQIVRESRALDAARSLGLVLEHQMAPDRFYYVMRYVPGESLSVVTQRLHAMSGSDGLDEEHLRSAMGYAQDLLVALDTYHNAELWHKDVKPDNIIVDGRGADARAHLVDFGLVTPMRSAMTLTTHGTEYFRDPELVRQALRGVKVHQIDGSKFDVYAAGAVLYSMIENSFPAHGGLSQITRRCPEALRWVVRRAMAEYDRRYPSAAVMLADLRVVMGSNDPFAVKPIDLPSVAEGDIAAADRVETEPTPDFGVGAAPDFARRAGSPVPPAQNGERARVGRPKTSGIHWWSGRYALAGSAEKPQAQEPARVGRPLRDRGDRRPANEQIKAARKRVQERRQNASKRIHASRGGRAGRKRDGYSNTPSAAVAFASVLGLAIVVGGAILAGSLLMPANHRAPQAPEPPAAAVFPDAPDGDWLAGQADKILEDLEVDLLDHDHEHEWWGEHSEEHDHDHAHASSASSSTASSSHASHTGLPHVHAHVLLMSLLPKPIEPELMEELSGGLAILRDQGLDILGGVGAQNADDEHAIEMIADLRNTLGSTPVDASGFSMGIQQWLNDQPIDGVLVLANAPGKPQDRRAIMVTDRSITNIPLNRDTAQGLLGVLVNNGYNPG